MTLEIDGQPTNINISDYFEVRQTQYGRACFAKKDIPKGVDVLVSNTPFTHVILHEFRKEVCASCFHYEFGKYCKVKISSLPNMTKKNFKGAGLWFCSESCKETWLQYDNTGELTEAFETFLEYFQMKAKTQIEETEYSPKITQEFIENYWKDINEWDEKITKMKKSKTYSKLPFLNEDEYTGARFIIHALFDIYKKHESLPLFNELQSNELQKTSRFPVLLRSQGLIYQFLRIVLPDYLQPFLTTDSLRMIFGREYGNSFGIWQLVDEGSNENKEFLGYCLFPEASFFNHSCSPNLKKFRKGNRMIFQTTKDIETGQQMCIDYFHILDEPLLVRQQTLSKNWFFDCACDRCSKELKTENCQVKPPLEQIY